VAARDGTPARDMGSHSAAGAVIRARNRTPPLVAPASPSEQKGQRRTEATRTRALGAGATNPPPLMGGFGGAGRAYRQITDYRLSKPRTTPRFAFWVEPPLLGKGGVELISRVGYLRGRGGYPPHSEVSPPA